MSSSLAPRHSDVEPPAHGRPRPLRPSTHPSHRSTIQSPPRQFPGPKSPPTPSVPAGPLPSLGREPGHATPHHRSQSRLQAPPQVLPTRREESLPGLRTFRVNSGPSRRSRTGPLTAKRTAPNRSEPHSPPISVLASDTSRHFALTRNSFTRRKNSMHAAAPLALPLL